MPDKAKCSHNGQRDIGLKSPDKGQKFPNDFEPGHTERSHRKNIATAVIFGTLGQKHPCQAYFGCEFDVAALQQA